MRLFGGEAFDEALVDKPIRVAAADATGLRATEFAYPRVLPSGARRSSCFRRGRRQSATHFNAAGRRRVIFSGVLDAWRYRGDDEDAFDTFWRSQLGRRPTRAGAGGHASSRSRDTLGLSSTARRGQGTDIADDGTGLSIPAVSARVIDEGGRAWFLRLWPTFEAGVFEASFAAPQPGRYDVQ